MLADPPVVLFNPSVFVDSGALVDSGVNPGVLGDFLLTAELRV